MMTMKPWTIFDELVLSFRYLFTTESGGVDAIRAEI